MEETVGNSSFVFQTPVFTGVENTVERVDFFHSKFDSLILDKGREVLVEKAIKCPCKSLSTNQQSDCRNCGGSGWLFINPKKTKILIQSMSITSETKPWSEEERGTINVTATHQEELSYMDRLTILDGQSIHQEVLHFHEKENLLFSYTSYNVIEVLYIGLFQSSTQKLLKLEENKDFTIKNNRVLLNLDYKDIKQYEPEFSFNEDLPSVTIRYKHCPSYRIIEMKRETMQSYVLDRGKEEVVNLPISAIARKANYIMNAQQLTAERILNNSFEEPTPTPCYPIEKEVLVDNSNTINVSKTDLNFSKIISYKVINSDFDEVTDYYVQPTQNSLIFYFNSLFLGKILIKGLQ